MPDSIETPLFAPAANNGGNTGRAPILVTGVAGLIGSAVARNLVARGIAIVGVDDLSAGSMGRMGGVDTRLFDFIQADVRDAAAMDEALRCRPSAVLHLAARVGVRRILAAPGACEVENVEGARVLASAVERAVRAGAPIDRVIAASTSEVYAESEQMLSEASPLRPRQAHGRWRYAASKLRAEDAFDALALGTPVAVSHLRFFNVTGPGQDAASGMVLPRFIERALRGEDLEVYGTGEQVRTFAHVDSVANDIAELVAPSDDRAPIRGALNVGGTARTSIGDLARLVASRAGTGSQVRLADPKVAVSSNFEEVTYRVPNLRALRALGLGRSPWRLEGIVDDMLARHGRLVPQGQFALQGSAAVAMSTVAESIAGSAAL